MHTKAVSVVAALSILASANAQYYSDVYGRDVGADYLDFHTRDVSDLTWDTLTARDLAQFSRRDLEELAARDPNFKSFMKKVGHGIKKGAQKVGKGLEKAGKWIGKEAVKEAPQLIEAAGKVAARDAVDLGLDVYARSLEDLEAREAEPDLDDYTLFDIYAREAEAEAEADEEAFPVYAREAYADPDIFDYEY